jgi:GAF domain-containing protein
LTTSAPLTRAGIEAAEIRTALSVPLRKGAALLGFIALRREVRPFSDKEIGLLENFAAQAVTDGERSASRDLRQRTDDLQESLEHQTTTSDALIKDTVQGTAKK